ncbi:MAG: hypothetical protein JXR84_15295 [Anaerolineae bacterium]|nr:hypothetical protein [Anaerolineae bacterium]
MDPGTTVFLSRMPAKETRSEGALAPAFWFQVWAQDAIQSSGFDSGVGIYG